MKRYAGAIGLLGLMATRAYAQNFNVVGGIDPGTALTSLESWAFILAGGAIGLTFIVKGVHAAMDGRHLLPHIGVALGGAVMAFGGPYALNHLGLG